MSADLRNIVDEDAAASKNSRSFDYGGETAGVPNKILVACLLVCVGLFVVMKSFYVPALLFLLLFYLMYKIHRDDSKALTVWARSMKRKAVLYSPGKTRCRAVLIYPEFMRKNNE